MTLRRFVIPFAVAIFLVLLALVACQSGGDDDGPLPAVVEDIVADRTPPSDIGFLESLALQRDDLPEGFVLELDGTDTVENGSLYLAKYFNSGVSGDEVLLKGAPLTTVDIVVVLFDSEQDAVAFLGVFESMTSAELVAYTEQQRHHPVGEEFEVLEQVGVEAHRLPFRRVGDGSVAWETIERIDFGQGIEIAFHDYSATIRQGRAIAIVALGATQQPPDSDEFDALVEVQNVRLKRGLEQ